MRRRQRTGYTGKVEMLGPDRRMARGLGDGETRVVTRAGSGKLADVGIKDKGAGVEC